MNAASFILKTLKVRIKDKHAPLLKQWAFECNQVWNEANAITAEWAVLRFELVLMVAYLTRQAHFLSVFVRSGISAS